MITFKEMYETKEKFSDAVEIITSTENLESTYDYAETINRKFMDNIHHLLGKNLNQAKKADSVYTWKRKTQYGEQGYNLQISRNGIGATSLQRYQIEPYERLIKGHREDDDDWQSQGLIVDVIDNKEVYNATLEYLNPKGKEVLRIIKEVRESTNIQLPKEAEIHKMITLSNDEKEFFGVSNNQGIIEITESGSSVKFTLSVLKDKKKNYEKDELFQVNELRVEKETDFAYVLFILNHKEDILAAVEEYKTTTKSIKESWEKFDSQMKERLAKFILLEKM